MYFILIFFIIITNHANSFIKKTKNINLLNINDVNDIRENIETYLQPREKDIIKNLNGFYGLIGPNIYMNNKVPDSLYDLFTGDGTIQGVFFENGKLTFVKHLVKTEKFLYEKQHGKIPHKNKLLNMLFTILNKLNMFPNILGTANTAILNVKNKNYALFERDYPYLLDINFANKNITTIGKIIIQKIKNFSGHSKRTKNGNIETIDYRIFNKKVSYYLLNPTFDIVNKYDFNFNYIPLIHDFYSTDKLLVLIDSPLVIDFRKVIFDKIPTTLDNKKSTFIYIFNKTNQICEKYIYEKGFYIFHYAYVQESQDKINIYVSIYDEFDFVDVKINGKYRMIEIDKKTKKVTINKNNELEMYNLDFPIRFEDKVILRNYEYPKINGFVIVKNLKIYKEIFFEKKNICGEHTLVYIKNIPYLFFFNVENDKNLLSFINLINYEIIDIDIPYKLNLGFHSIFLNNAK